MQGSFIYGGDGGIPAASPLLGLALDRLRGLFHRPLDTLPVRQLTGLSHNGRALSGPNPTYRFYDKYNSTHEGCYCIYGGDGGIRTHVPLRTTAFRVRLVMTASIRLQNHYASRRSP